VVSHSDAAAQPAGKISKSTGAAPFSELLSRHSPETIRFFLLSTHYRSPIQYSEELLEETARSLETFYRFFKRYERITGERYFDVPPAATRGAAQQHESGGEVATVRQRFLDTMDDDFNTGVGVAALFDLVRSLNKLADVEKLEEGKPSAAKLSEFKRGAATLRELSATLGLFLKPIEAKAVGGDDALVGQLVELLIEARANARKNKDFATADTIRKRLGEIGIVLEDRPGGTEWTRG
jgi:cysteinyl-tRNA synthetase